MKKKIEAEHVMLFVAIICIVMLILINIGGFKW